MGNLKKLTQVFTICLTFCILLSQASFANGVSINSVTRLNLSRGTVSGFKASYTLNIKSNWQTYLIADRETFEYPTNGIIEKITFYYVPQDKMAKPVTLMTFYVYERAYWSNKTIIRKIITTESHVFAVSTATLNPFSDYTDWSAFGKLLGEANNDTYVKNMIKFPPGTKIITNNLVSVSGRDMVSPSVRTGNIVYIPVRDVCNALGYQVGWVPKTKTITLQKGIRFYYIMRTIPQIDRQSLDAVIINNKAYASSIFFTQILKVSVEIDEYNNVYIIE